MSAFVSMFVASTIQVYLSSLNSYFAMKNFFTSIAFNSYIYSASVEELAKISFFMFSCKFIPAISQYKNDINNRDIQNNRETNTNKEISLLAMIFATSFATFENIAYSVYAPTLVLLRLVTSTLLHIFIAPIYIGIFKKKIISSMVLPIFIHGTYNFLINASSITFLFSICIVLSLLFKNLYSFTTH